MWGGGSIVGWWDVSSWSDFTACKLPCLVEGDCAALLGVCSSAPCTLTSDCGGTLGSNTSNLVSWGLRKRAKGVVEMDARIVTVTGVIAVPS